MVDILFLNIIFKIILQVNCDLMLHTNVYGNTWETRYNLTFLKKHFAGHLYKSFLWMPLIPLFWTTFDVSSGFQNLNFKYLD